MKKMLTLVLVLAVTSLAGAAQNWTITGSSAVQNAGLAGWEVNPGDVLSMALSSGSTTTAGVAIDIITDNGAAGTINSLIANALFTVGSAGTSVTGLNALLASMSMPPTTYATDDWSMVSLAVGGDMVAANTTIMTLTYSVGSTLGLVTINGLADNGTVGWEQNLNMLTLTEGNTAMLPISLNVVPEPITMALLGIGGLFLRRKK